VATPRVRLLADLSVHGAIKLAINGTDFPSPPELGMLCFKEGILYGYQTIDGFTSWYPLTQRTKFYIFKQTAPAAQWVVPHALGSLETWYQVQDGTGQEIFCSRNVVDASSFTLDFTEPCTGSCLVIAPDSITIQNATLGTLNVADKVTADATGLYIDGVAVTAGPGGGGDQAINPLTVKNVSGNYTVVASDINDVLVRVEAPLNTTGCHHSRRRYFGLSRR
jgi:hypothetical protein